jgi:hypothetical protein
MQTRQGLDAQHGGEFVSHQRSLSTASLLTVWPTQFLASSSPTENKQHATMQAPQGLDAKHRGQLFPV